MSLKQIENQSNDLVIAQINMLISQINDEKFSKSRELRETLIQLCEQYLVAHSIEQLIPLDNEIVNAVFELQRQMVAIQHYLPNADSLAKARWKLIKNIVVGEKNELRDLSNPSGLPTPSSSQVNLTSGFNEGTKKHRFELQNSGHSISQFRALRHDYWSEARFQGAISMQNWVENGEPRMSFEKFKLERLQSSNLSNIHYITDSNLFKLEYDPQTKLFYQEGRPANAGGYSSMRGGIIGCEFVVDIDGNIHTLPINRQFTNTRHSSFLRGQPVLFAGMCEIENGKFIWITNESGHYKGKPQHLLQFLDRLKEKYQLDLNTIKIKVVSAHNNPYECDADEFQSLRVAPLSSTGRDILRNLFYETVGTQINSVENAHKIAEVSALLRILSSKAHTLKDSFFKNANINAQQFPENVKQYLQLREELLNDNTKEAAVTGLINMLTSGDESFLYYVRPPIHELLNRVVQEEVDNLQKQEISDVRKTSAIITILKIDSCLASNGVIWIKSMGSISEIQLDDCCALNYYFYGERPHFIFEESTNTLFYAREPFLHKLDIGFERLKHLGNIITTNQLKELIIEPLRNMQAKKDEQEAVDFCSITRK